VAREREDENERSERTDKFWSEMRVDPVEVALPSGVGYTLRAYRMSDELPVAGTSEDEDLDEVDGPELTKPAAGDESSDVDEPEDEDLDAKDDAEDEDDLDAVDDEDDEDEEEDDDEDDEKKDEDGKVEAPEEVPVFLAHRGRVYLFASREGLVDFVKSDAPHDLASLDTWATVVDKIRVDDVVPAGDDRYELDLVVENLRGGHDAWDAGLVIAAGEIARDIGYSLRLEPVITALSTGSPLDDLDEALRGAEAGGLGSFLARRRARKIGAQQAALAWRTIIGKISAAVDWRD